MSASGPSRNHLHPLQNTTLYSRHTRSQKRAHHNQRNHQQSILHLEHIRYQSSCNTYRRTREQASEEAADHECGIVWGNRDTDDEEAGEGHDAEVGEAAAEGFADGTGEEGAEDDALGWGV